MHIWIHVYTYSCYRTWASMARKYAWYACCSPFDAADPPPLDFCLNVDLSTFPGC